MVKLLTKLGNKESVISLHRRRRVCELRVRVEENTDDRITHAILPCVFFQKKPDESMIIKKENVNVKTDTITGD